MCWTRLSPRKSERLNKNDHPIISNTLRKLNCIRNEESPPSWAKKDRNAGSDKYFISELWKVAKRCLRSIKIDRINGEKRWIGTIIRVKSTQKSSRVSKRKYFWIKRGARENSINPQEMIVTRFYIYLYLKLINYKKF